ncbi:outer membrane protein assembly factor BamB [Caenimonas sp. SL110]|uniref:outer membrane protein assembly factor BamB n=1 Tax=Caenimonas sp. SL110 TaxID=1450524 RepID=UPI00069DE223|nr:outer membrane protein assembly factor BamB [Caenimonas sp. SL110]
MILTSRTSGLAGNSLRAVTRLAGAIAVVAALAGCQYMPQVSSLPSFLGGGSDKPKPAELQPNPSLIPVRQAWVARVGAVTLPLSVHVSGTTVAVAGADGGVALIDAVSGRDLWRASAAGPIAAGVGSDGRMAAVVTRSNELVAFAAGKEVWRAGLGASGYTAPFVAGGRVFVLTADRAVSAFDGQTGRKLWTQVRAGSEPLVLRHNGVMLAVGDTLVVGMSGRLIGMNPATGAARWEAPIASPRGINDVERLVDLVGTVSRVDNSVCARAFQATVGCVDAARGVVAWSRPASGAEGVSGDERLVFGTESDGKVIAWRRDTGERAWMTDKLSFRGLSGPLSLGRSVVVGDASGYVHMLSREDGSLLNRVATDGSAIAASPVVAGNTLVVVTRAGGVYGFTPN